MRDAVGSRRKNTAIVVMNVQTYSTVIETAIVAQTPVANGLETLKWLVVPAAAAPTMRDCSMSNAAATTVPATDAVRRNRGRCAISHAQVTLYSRIDSENFSGLIQVSTPVTCRWSTARPIRQTTVHRTMRAATVIKGRCQA